MFRDALERAFRVAVVRVAIRRREVVAVVRPRGRVLVLQTLWWPDEVREPEFGFVDVVVRPVAAEVRVAASLVDSMTAALDLSVFSDGYRDAVAGLIEERAASAIPVARAPGETGGGPGVGGVVPGVRSGSGGEGVE